MAAVLLCISPLVVETRPDFSGLWRIDLDHHDARDLYDEIRLIRQTEKGITLTIVDYGSAWIAGEFRDVVHILPWTFRFDRWGPRRGPADSKQPRTRATWTGDTLLLEKATFSGNGEFRWRWNIADDKIVPQETGGSIWFMRTNPDDASLASLHERLPRRGTIVSKPTGIAVSATAVLDGIIVQCP